MIDDEVISQTDSTKLLGLMIDEHLNWIDHVKTVYEKHHQVCTHLEKSNLGI